MRVPVAAAAALALVVAAPGRARAQIENVELLAHVDRGERYSGNWGYTSPGGVELAISGTYTGTTFIDATDPAGAHEVAFIPGPTSIWREMATYGEHCYIVTEGNGAALQIVSLADPLHPVLVTTLNPPLFWYARAHEIKIDPATGFCYVAGTNPGAGQPNRGLVILDLSGNPTRPQLRGTWTENYVHDLSIQNGRAYCASIYDGIVYVLDVTEAGTPPVLGQWTYPNAFTHNTWPTADGSFLVTTDENNGGHLRMWDIRNLSLPLETGEWISPNGAVVHNAYLRGSICYMSHYTDGLRVVDASDPYNLVPVGWYNTGDAWGCWCFAADPTIAYISDIDSGTYILRFVPPAARVAEEEPSPGRGRLRLAGFPSPCRAATSIHFDLPVAVPVSLRIHDASGRAVRSLVDGLAAAGPRSVAWDGRNDAGERVASGVYLVNLRTPGLAESTSLVVAH